jgi:hypothetical protein
MLLFEKGKISGSIVPGMQEQSDGIPGILYLVS